MPTQAPLVRDAELSRLKSACLDTRYPERNWLIVCLSFKAGLRAVEIANAKRFMMMSPAGEIDEWLSLPRTISKAGSPRRIPMPRHSVLWEAGLAYFKACPGTPNDPLILSERAEADEWLAENDDPRPMTRQSVAYIFWKIYRNAGLPGRSSHSGRRTFLTKTAKAVGTSGGTLRDVQYLAGHKSLVSTQGYVEINEEVHLKLASLL